MNMRLNGESDQSFKRRFISERSRQYDNLRDKEAAFSSANECSVRSSAFTNTGYQWRSQPDNLVPPSKFQSFIIIHFFRN